ncbi:uncharacterized protein LOC124458263 [Xenia sp. Carnegie-2017]|uniref:uncharacterized protein LOC124458263 n=1 Tax=Xenia sp. Carnegie-2017 TaxID=2897299 RepID=UPI001F03AD4A|nr:uncharacterized protein LOC124458263 [Xenia sp. Carnegie-2017]
MEEPILRQITSQDFFEVYKLLSKSGLLENISSLCESDIFEEFMREFMTYCPESKNIPMKDSNLLNEVDDYTSCLNTLHQAVTTTSMVEFPDLKEIYEKVQSRAGGGSHQRVACGTINIKATSEGQLCGMNVFVQRMPEAAALCGDVNGRIPLEVNHEDYFQNQQHYSVDLDSVYTTPGGNPVYKLATVNAEKRNLFQLVVILKFIDGSDSETFFSEPFLIRSRKPGSRNNSFDHS